MSATNTKDSRSDRMQKMFAARMDLKDYVMENAQRDDVQNILDTIDKFSSTKQHLMHIGNQRGKILDQAIEIRQPKSVLELGTFIGYGSLRIVAPLPKDALLITIEADPQSAEIARSIHEYAGVTDRIKIVNDYTENVFPRLKQDFNIDSFDLIFIDHYESVYLRDLKMLEELDLIKSGTMLVADNVIKPGAPDYLEYIRNNPNYTNVSYNRNFGYSEDIHDQVDISVRK